MAIFARTAASRPPEKIATGRDITDDVEQYLFVPSAIHYAPHTLLTKNGELLQTIKIIGFAHEDITQEDMDLRSLVRHAITECIPTTDYALWFHTVRRKQDLSPEGQYRKDFSGYLNKCWHERNQWGEGYTNEVYVTIVKEGQSAKLVDPTGFIRGLWPANDTKHREAFLEESAAALNDTVERMLSILSTYGASRLGLTQRDGVYYSEPCEFLGKLITLTDRPWPMPEMDLSKYLTEYEITFGYNALEVQHRDGRRRFGAMVTLKEYHELPLPVLEKFLQLPAEFIISQCVDFIPREQAIADYNYQNYLYQTSGSDLRDKSGLAAILQNMRGSPVDFGEHQISIFLIADTLKILDKEVLLLVDTLESIGLLALREDIKLEECYWATLPANFEFVKRLRPIDTPRLAGFANLSNFPAGLRESNRWGPAVSVLRTAAGTPYYFNFHIGDIGHTSILGPQGAGKTVLLNFLIAQAQKFRPHLFYFDQNRASEIFIRSIGGTYYSARRMKMNPFALADSPEHRRFMAVWLHSLTGGHAPDAAQLAFYRKAVDTVMELPASERTLRKAVEWIGREQPQQAAAFAAWVNNGAHASLFDHLEDTVSLDTGAVGFDMAEVEEDPALLPPILSYLLHRVTLQLTGAPVMIVLDEAWKLLDTPLFKGNLSQWLSMLTERGAMAIFATENVGHALQSSLSPTLMEGIATQIYLPDSDPNEAYSSVFGLSEQERDIVNSLPPGDRRFLMKRGHEAILVSLDLQGMKECLAILSANEHRLALMTECIQTKGDDPAQWISAFLKKL